MKLRRSLAAVLVMFALGGGGLATTEQGQTQYAPYSHDSGSDTRSGADGGASGGCSGQTIGNW
jgi:hypothetical protein